MLDPPGVYPEGFLDIRKGDTTLDRQFEVLFYLFYDKLIKEYGITNADKALNSLAELFDCNKTVLNSVYLDLMIGTNMTPKNRELYYYARKAGYSAREVAKYFGLSTRTIQRYDQTAVVPRIPCMFDERQRKEIKKFLVGLHRLKELIIC